MTVLRYFTRADIALIVALFTLSAVGFGIARRNAVPGGHIVVEVDGRTVMELSLDQDVTTSVAGPLGDTVLEVHDHGVAITDSPCPNKYCIRMGSLELRGEMAVCVPNRVVVIVTGGGDEGFDGVVQ